VCESIKARRLGAGGSGSDNAPDRKYFLNRIDVPALNTADATISFISSTVWPIERQIRVCKSEYSLSGIESNVHKHIGFEQPALICLWARVLGLSEIYRATWDQVNCVDCHAETTGLAPLAHHPLQGWLREEVKTRSIRSASWNKDLSSNPKHFNVIYINQK